LVRLNQHLHEYKSEAVMLSGVVLSFGQRRWSFETWPSDARLTWAAVSTWPGPGAPRRSLTSRSLARIALPAGGQLGWLEAQVLLMDVYF
jgi:hypothetical protein